jgi:hypothetical protein
MMLKQHYHDWPAAQVNEAVPPSEDDQRRACIDTALGSDNPAVVDALDKLLVLVRLVAPGDYQDCVEHRSLFSLIAGIHVLRIDPCEAHAMLDTVLASHDSNAIFALDNFIDVARTHWPRGHLPSH